MSRPAVAGICAAVLLVGFVVGRVTGSGSSRTVTVPTTVDRVVVVPAQHVGSADDARDEGPLDVARVASVRRGALLRTTITAANAWANSLIPFRNARVHLWILYDTDHDGRPDRRDRVLDFGGRLTSWISTFNQGVQAADVTRRSARTISVARDARIFYSGSRESGLLDTSPIGVAVVARWKGGRDRAPDHGWIVVAPPDR